MIHIQKHDIECGFDQTGGHSRQFSLERSINDCLITLERLPRTFAHQDFYEFNILLNSDRLQKGRLAVIDWQFASLSGIGEDLGRFIGLSFSRGHVPIDKGCRGTFSSLSSTNGQHNSKSCGVKRTKYI
ncbi:phosphotransferase [Paenibacillus sp. LMG 31458]|uniref:Phosphotransferase n=1 Tax=Paenibacillus phytorum TaxID=2654977 RepID=A0ABX1XX73_9BACL|nr:phosphotransferase [Paenibacillus phytorum]NOU72651.1 phosphotransferase [Paenibacillus phytorum]